MTTPGCGAENLDAWLARIEAMHPRGADGIELGLARIEAVRRRLPAQLAAPVILVAGTNGKGSTCALLDAVLSAAGYRIGRYSSPHLLAYNERVRVGGRAVRDSELVAAFALVEAARANVPLTYFEFGTLAAVQVFASAQLDAVILEVGLGGRLDATNVFAPRCAIVTTVDLDHQQWLGPDREAIGREKAGVFRPAIPAICGDPDPPRSLVAHAGAIGAPLQVRNRDFGYSVLDRQWSYWSHAAAGRARSALAFPALRGRQQLANAATALAALDALQADLPTAMRDVREGFLSVELAGRFQVVPGRPTIVLDVAHNAEAARVLAANLADMAFHPRTLAVFGMMADKDVAAVIAAMGGRVDMWFPCALPGSRPASAEFLSRCLEAAGERRAGSFAGPAEALAAALGEAGEADRILTFGSFLTVAGALSFLGRPA